MNWQEINEGNLKKTLKKNEFVWWQARRLTHNWQKQLRQVKCFQLIPEKVTQKFSMIIEYHM